VPSQFPPKDWQRAAAANVRELTFFPTHKETYYFRSDKQVMTFARNFFDMSTTLSPHPKVLGTLYFDVDVSVFDELFNDIQLGPKDVVTITTADKAVIYSNVRGKIGQVEQGGREARAAEDFVMRTDVPNAKLTLEGRFSKQDLFSSLSHIKSFLAIVVIGCIVSLIAMSLAFSRRFSLPIRGIIKVMAKVESGNLDIQVPVRSEDELGQLAHGFNRMTSRLGLFIHEVYVAKLERKQAELNALKSQIRPHYLYNTLEVIRMSAVASDAMPVADMIHSLSNQLKYVLDYGEDIVSIREELGHLDDYYRLIRIRFEDKIELETIVAADVAPEWGMLKLAVQTLVENAVQHGVRPKGGRGKIRVTIEKTEGEELLVTVFDNGVGMTENRLSEVRQLLEGTVPEEARKHVGLKNVQDRLQSLFGDGFGLILNSRPNVGTSVTFKLPVIRGEARHAEHAESAAGR
jgi:two-component system sensor histidine kinase YesM